MVLYQFLIDFVVDITYFVKPLGPISINLQTGRLASRERSKIEASIAGEVL